jgi:hypothetical protein
MFSSAALLALALVQAPQDDVVTRGLAPDRQGYCMATAWGIG